MPSLAASLVIATRSLTSLPVSPFWSWQVSQSSRSMPLPVFGGEGGPSAGDIGVWTACAVFVRVIRTL